MDVIMGMGMRHLLAASGGHDAPAAHGPPAAPDSHDTGGHDTGGHDSHGSSVPIYRPEAVHGSCEKYGIDDPNGHCTLWVNTAIYPPLFLEIGPPWEHAMARGCQWFTFVFSVGMVGWLIYNMYTGHCGWEVIFVTIIELTKIIVELFYEYDTPCMLFSVFGPVTPWLRYLEWLLTCPVILMHVSNMTGLEEEYSTRTMNLLISDQGCILFGATAAMHLNGWLKVILFVIGCCFGINTFYVAGRIFIESYHAVPKGLCRKLTKYLAALYFASWTLFPLYFIAGPEGVGFMTWAGTTIAHTIADLISKNIWGLLAHYMQVKIREHIILHGDIRKTVEHTVGGQTFEVEEFTTKDDEEAEEVEESRLDRRASFQRIAAKMENQGKQVMLNKNAHQGQEESEEKAEAGFMMGMHGDGIKTFSPDEQAQMQMMLQQMQMMQRMQQQQMMQHMPAQQMQMTGQMSPGPMAGQMTPTPMAGQMSPTPMAGHMSPNMHMMAQPQMMYGQLSPGQMSPGGPMYPGGQVQMGHMMSSGSPVQQQPGGMPTMMNQGGYYGGQI